MKSSQEQNEKMNPYQVLYWNPHIHSQKFAKMTAKYHAEQTIEILKKIACLTDRQFFKSSEINWRQRKKYKEWGFQAGREKFYLLPKNY